MLPWKQAVLVVETTMLAQVEAHNSYCCIHASFVAFGTEVNEWRKSVSVLDDSAEIAAVRNKSTQDEVRYRYHCHLELKQESDEHYSAFEYAAVAVGAAVVV